MTPIYIFLIFLLMIFIIQNKTINMFTLFIQILNLQGLFNKAFQGMGHLWFVTVIMICYLLTPVFLKILGTRRFKFNIFTLLVLFLLQIVISYLPYFNLFGIYLVYIYVYFAGFLFKRYNWINVLNHTYLNCTLMIISIIARLYFRFLFDGTLFYNNIIAPYTQACFGICLFWLMYFLFNTKAFSDKVSNGLLFKFIRILDLISYDVYITHYIFCVGPVSIIGFVTSSYVLDTVIFFILTFASSFLLFKLTKLITAL